MAKAKKKDREEDLLVEEQAAEEAPAEQPSEEVIAEEPEPEKAPARKKADTYRIRNRIQAGQTVHGMEGYAEFDGEGVAEVSQADFEFFRKVPGYTEA